MSYVEKQPASAEKKLDDKTLQWLLTLKELDNRITDEETRSLLYALVDLDLEFHKRDCRRAFRAGYAKGKKESESKSNTTRK